MSTEGISLSRKIRPPVHRPIGRTFHVIIGDSDTGRPRIVTPQPLPTMLASLAAWRYLEAGYAVQIGEVQ